MYDTFRGTFFLEVYITLGKDHCRCWCSDLKLAGNRCLASYVRDYIPCVRSRASIIHDFTSIPNMRIRDFSFFSSVYQLQ